MVGLLARLVLERLEQRLVAGTFLHTVGASPFTSGSGRQPSGSAPGQRSAATARLAAAGQYQSGASLASCSETDSAAFALTARSVASSQFALQVGDGQPHLLKQHEPVVYEVGYLIHEAVAVAVDRFYDGLHCFFAHFLGNFFYTFHK